MAKNIFGADWLNPNPDDYKRRMYEEMHKVMAGTTIAPLSTDATSYTGTNALRDAIIQRMRGSPKFDHWHPVYVGSTQNVVVFIVHKGQPTYLEDEFNMFPSDAFITKLRLMLG